MQVAGLLPPARKKRRHDDLLQALDLAESGLLPGLRHPPRPWLVGAAAKYETVVCCSLSHHSSLPYVITTIAGLQNLVVTRLDNKVVITL